MGACDMETATQSLFVLGNSVPDDSCVVKASGGTQVFLSQGVLDLSIGTRYTAFMFVQNEFPTLDQISGFDGQDARLDSATVTITGMELAYRINPTLLSNAEVIAALQANSLPATTDIKLTRSATGTILPNNSTAIIADIIPEDLGAALRAMPHLAAGGQADIVVEVVLVGFRADESVVKSAPWAYKVRLCNNCLVQHVFPEAVARQPFRAEELLGEPLSLDDIYGTGVCTPGADDYVPNAYCGAVWGPDNTGSGDACALERCLGSAATLPCASDQLVVPAPN
jgi:hypothetical protein